jgi:hypothetical protein
MNWAKHWHRTKASGEEIAQLAESVARDGLSLPTVWKCDSL